VDLTQQELLQDALARRAAPLNRAERRAELVCGGLFVIAVALLSGLEHGPTAWNVPAAIGCALGLAVATRIRFEVGGLFTVPSQLMFIPLLYWVPPHALPLVVVAALLASRLPEVLVGDVPPARLLLCVANGWFSIGPAVVLTVAGGIVAVAASPWLVAALIASQIGADLAASAVRELIARGASLREQLGEALWVYSVDIALTPVAFLAADDVVMTLLALGPLLLLLSAFARERTDRLESVFELTRAYKGMALVLGDVVEADDQYTGEHCRDVVELAGAVGRELGLGADERRNLEFGALLHDVGKVAVPKELINKPGPLTADEYEIVKTHAVEGQRMLDRVGGFMRDVGVIVRHHHERWDGAGYPDGLAGEAIPLSSRIVACCDALNAMTTTRPYRRAISVERALAELRRCSGSQFDPRVVAAVRAVLERGEATDERAVATAEALDALLGVPSRELATLRS
jgi:putative nucleotidyltransferase with HDIG domain